MSNTILIPARSGSTRVKNKNLRTIGGRTLLALSIEQAKKSEAGEIIVSTDSDEIAEEAVNNGASVPFLRPKIYSTAQSTSISVILHMIMEYQRISKDLPKHIIFKPPTNPFLTGKSINEMAKMKEKFCNTDSILSIFEPRCSALSFVDYNEETRAIKTEIYSVEGVKLYDVERSQDRPKSYAGSPACKITNTKYFLENYEITEKGMQRAKGATYNMKSCLGYEINRKEAFDIDNNDDLNIAEAIYG